MVTMLILRFGGSLVPVREGKREKGGGGGGAEV